MIKNLFVLSFVLFSLSASAAEQAQLPSNVIAQVRTAGGFGPRPLGEAGIRIFADGTIVSFHSIANPQQVGIAKLSDRKLAELRAVIDQLRLSRLVALDAGRPQCADAPSTEYAVNASRAGALVIGREVSCQRFEDQSSAGNQLLSVLRGLLALAQINAQSFGPRF